MKLRKSLEPALSRELTHGGGFQKDAIVLPVCKARVSTGRSDQCLQAKSDQRLLLPFSGSGERSFLSAPTWLRESGWAQLHMHGGFSAP